MFSDANFAEDKVTTCSTTGVIAIFADGAASWTSQLPKMTALSMTVAEINAASEEAKELVWLKCLFSEVLPDFVRETPVLYIDNASAIKLNKIPEHHKSSKHIEVRHFYVRERYLDGDFGIEHVDGRRQPADLLTKPIEHGRFKVLCWEVGITPKRAMTGFMQCSLCDSVLEEMMRLNHCTLEALSC